MSGGALPLENAVLLGLSRFNKILDINPLARTARVQPGVRNLAISEAAARHGLYYAPDPSSQIACTIGGNVAENSGGVHCLKYGLTVHNVLELKVVTPEGELVTFGSAALDSAGFDLLALMNGSEGMPGIVVEVLVKLLPKPERAQVLLAGPKIRVPCRRPLITRLLLYGRYSSQKTTGYCTDPYQPVIRALSTAGG